MGFLPLLKIGVDGFVSCDYGGVGEPAKHYCDKIHTGDLKCKIMSFA